MKTAVIYTRVSTTEQADTGTSLATQAQSCKAWCEAHEFDVVKLFSDAGESAKTADRPQLLALISWCSQHKPDVCVVWKFDRWARNATDHAVAAAALSKHGTRLVSATEAATDDPAGRLLQTILSGIAQFDNEVKAERAKQAMRSVALRGGWVTTTPTGYKKARSGTLPILVEDPDKAPLIRELFAGLADGRRNLAQTVTMAKEHNMAEKCVRKLLHAPIYAGIIRSRLTDGQDIDAAFQGLIKRDIWIAAQDAISGKKRSSYVKQRVEFPLRGVIRCSSCGEFVTAGYSRGRTQTYGYYQCKHGHVRARVEIVHESWFRLLKQAEKAFNPMLKDIKAAIRKIIPERLAVVQAVEKNAVTEVKRLRSARSRLLDAYVSGAVDHNEFMRRDSDFSIRIKAANDAANKKTEWGIDIEDAISKCVQMLDDPVTLWRKMPIQKQQRFAKALYGDDLQLFSDGECRTGVSGGIASVLQNERFNKINMAPPQGECLNPQFIQAIKILAEIAA